jgi:hypothetical protein
MEEKNALADPRALPDAPQAESPDLKSAELAELAA